MPQKSPPRNFKIVGNWKMNGTAGDLAEIEAIAAGVGEMGLGDAVLLCLPATLLSRAAELKLPLGGQACHASQKGAHTGEVSAAMLRDAGAVACLCGHSESRAAGGLSDADVSARAKAALGASLLPIVCIGEAAEVRDRGETPQHLAQQLATSLALNDKLAALNDNPACTPTNTWLAYEPLWAIGSGKTPAPAEIAALHQGLRAQLHGAFGEQAAAMPLLYGGSVGAENVAEIMAGADVDGVLVGGASLKAKTFLPLIEAATHTYI